METVEISGDERLAARTTLFFVFSWLHGSHTYQFQGAVHGGGIYTQRTHDAARKALPLTAPPTLVDTCAIHD
jgi:hypothetical protein